MLDSICLLHAGTWGSIELPSVGQEAFIGWRGETYLPPPASPKAAAAAEPLLPDTSAVHAPPLPDTAEVDQVCAAGIVSVAVLRLQL